MYYDNEGKPDNKTSSSKKRKKSDDEDDEKKGISNINHKESKRITNISNSTIKDKKYNDDNDKNETLNDRKNVKQKQEIQKGSMDRYINRISTSKEITNDNQTRKE